MHFLYGTASLSTLIWCALKGNPSIKYSHAGFQIQNQEMSDRKHQEAHHVSQLDIPGIAGLESPDGAVHPPHVCLNASSTDNNLTTEETTTLFSRTQFIC